ARTDARRVLRGERREAAAHRRRARGASLRRRPFRGLDMTIDPETLRQIELLSHDRRPLLVLDVDDVLLHFVAPLVRYFEHHGCTLRLETFRLFGNVFEIESGAALANERVAALLDGFFGAQTEWQTPVEGATRAVATIARTAEVVLLTAMPHRHRET